jgi:hypothetical protein
MSMRGSFERGHAGFIRFGSRVDLLPATGSVSVTSVTKSPAARIVFA